MQFSTLYDLSTETTQTLLDMHDLPLCWRHGATTFGDKIMCALGVNDTNLLTAASSLEANPAGWAH